MKKYIVLIVAFLTLLPTALSIPLANATSNIAIDGSNSCSNSSGTTCSASLTTTHINDIIIVFVSGCGSGCATVSVSDSSLLTWTTRASSTSLGGDFREFFAKSASILSGDSVLFTASAGTVVIGTVFGVSNAVFANPFDGTTQQNSGTGTSASISLTTTFSTDFVFGDVLGTTSQSPGSGFTQIALAGSFSESEYQIFNGPQTVSVSWTFGSSTWAGMADALQGIVNPINTIQISPVFAYSMDTVTADKYTASASASNNKVRMIDTTPFHNDATPCSSTVTSYIQGAAGAAQLFNGNDCWQIASNANLHADSFGNYLSMALWFRPDVIPVSGVVCPMSKSSEYAMCLDSSGKMEFWLNGANQLTGTTVLSAGSFYFVSEIWNSTNVQIYVSGRNETISGASYSTIPSENSNPVIIGCATSSLTSCITGAIGGGVFLFKRPLFQIDLITLSSESLLDRPIDIYTPDTTVGTTGLNLGNPELPFCNASSANCDINSTEYLPGPLAFHQTVQFGTSGATTVAGCTASISGNNLCNRLRFEWSFFHQGVYQMTMGVEFSVEHNTNLGVACITGGQLGCNLYVTFFSITQNTLNILNTYKVTDLGDGCNPGQNLVSGSCVANSFAVNEFWWFSVDLWLLQDGQHFGIRATNFGNSTGIQQGWLATFNNAQFAEQYVPLVDVNGATHTADWYDVYTKQNIDIFTQFGTDAGGHATGIVQIHNHIAGYIIDADCFDIEGTNLPGQACLAISNCGQPLVPYTEAPPTPRSIIQQDFSCGCDVTISHPCGAGSGTSGGLPTPPVPSFSTGNTNSCGILNAICDVITPITSGITNGISAVFAPILSILQGLAVAIASAIISGLIAGWQLFVGGLDQIIYLLTGQRGVFSSFISTVGSVILSLFNNFGTIVQFLFTGFTNAVSILASITSFFTVNGTHIFSIVSTFTSNLLTPSGIFSTAIFGAINFFWSLFGQGGGGNGSTFCVGGTLNSLGTACQSSGVFYDWGPATILTKSLLPLFYIFAFLFLFERFMLHPWQETQNLMYGVSIVTNVLISVMGWFLDTFIKIVNFIKGFIPTMG